MPQNDIQWKSKSEYLKIIPRIFTYHIIPYLVFFLIIFLLFRENITLGMDFDEVIRINNIIPLLNPGAEPYNQSIFNISLSGLTIPLMYKFYLSTALLLPYLPLYFFKNNLLYGLRFLYGFYFFLSISIFFFFMSKKFNFTLSFLTSLLIITSPLLYPEGLIGFAHCIHLIFLSSAVYCFYVFFEKNNKTVYLFLGTFLLFFEANIEAYFLWVIAALVISSIVVFPHYWKTVLGSIKYFMIMIFAIILGWVNFVIYNILSPYATIEPLYLKIFDPLQYNQQPVDYTQAAPLLDDISVKINSLFPSFFDGYGIVYIMMIIALICLNIFVIVKIIKMQEFSKYKKYFFPFFCFCLIFVLILISPNTTRAGHYVYLIPFFEISIVSFFMVCENVFNKTYFSKLLVITLICLVILNTGVSGMAIMKYQDTKGRHYFSPAIFALNNYINNESLQSEDIIFLEWGMYTQLYFLNNGEFKIKSIVFQLYDTKSYEERKAAFTKFFTGQKNPGRSNTLYFPLYKKGFDTRNDAILTDFNRFIKENNGTLTKIQTLYETNGDEVINIYELENSAQFFETVKKNSE